MGIKRPPLSSPEYNDWWKAATQAERDADIRRVWAYPSAVFFQDLAEAYEMQNFHYLSRSPFPYGGDWLRWVDEQADWLRRVDAGDCFMVDYAPPGADFTDFRPTDYTWACGCDGPYDSIGRVIIADCNMDCAEYAAHWDNLTVLGQIMEMVSSMEGYGYTHDRLRISIHPADLRDILAGFSVNKTAQPPRAGKLLGIAYHCPPFMERGRPSVTGLSRKD